MLTSILVSLPPDTLRQMHEADARAQGGGSRAERGAGLAILIVAATLAPLVAWIAH